MASTSLGLAQFRAMNVCCTSGVIHASSLGFLGFTAGVDVVGVALGAVDLVAVGPGVGGFVAVAAVAAVGDVWPSVAAGLVVVGAGTVAAARA